MSYVSQLPKVRMPGGVMFLPQYWGQTGSEGTASILAGTANLAYYHFFVAPYTTAIVSMSFYCISGTDNHDLGVYSADGARKLGSRGSTATTAAVVNTWTPATSLPIQGGVGYWAAFATAGTKLIQRITGSSNRSHTLGGGMAKQASALPLPATLTLAPFDTETLVPILTLTLAT